MRAVVFNEHGGPAVLQVRDDLPVPTPGVGEVIVQVRHAALNRLDDFVRRGWKGLNLSFPHILGADFSGVIADLGKGVAGWTQGQRVVANPTLWCGMCPACRAGRHNQCDRFAILGEHVAGAFAEYVRVPARNLLAIPGHFSDDLAAAAPLVGVTAWHMLITAGNIRPGEMVLVVGAGGGVNGMAIQIARLAGATVCVVASNSSKAERVFALGANCVIDASQTPDWSKAVWDATGRRGADIVVDNVGEATWSASLRSLAKAGRLLTVGGTSGYTATTPINLLFGKHLHIIGTTMGTQADFEAVMGQVFAGKLVPVIDQVFPLGEYSAALQRLLGGDAFGKILLRVS